MTWNRTARVHSTSPLAWPGSLDVGVAEVGPRVWSLLEDLEAQDTTISSKLGLLKSDHPIAAGQLRALARDIRQLVAAGTLGSEASLLPILPHAAESVPYATEGAVRTPLVIAAALDLLADLAGLSGFVRFVDADSAG